MTAAVSALSVMDEGEALRAAMRHLARGVAVVTAGIGEQRTGLTATSTFSLSLDPPTMIVCVNRNASALPVIASNRHFCVNLLASHQRAIADRFTGRDGAKGAARYDGARWLTLATGAAALADAVAVVDCEVEEIIERHSHAVLIGLAKAVRVNGGEPLVYSDGSFGTFRALDGQRIVGSQT